MSCYSQGYNKNKDYLVNRLLNTMPITVSVFRQRDSSFCKYEYTWEEYRLVVYKENYIPYTQKERWMYFLTSKSGRNILIQGGEIYNLRYKTYERIKNYYKEITQMRENN